MFVFTNEGNTVKREKSVRFYTITKKLTKMNKIGKQ